MSRLDLITSRFSFRGRSTSTASSSRASSSNRDSLLSTSPAASTINSIIFRQPSMLDLEEERKSFGHELGILEPRPVVFFGSLEERLGSPML